MSGGDLLFYGYCYGYLVYFRIDCLFDLLVVVLLPMLLILVEDVFGYFFNLSIDWIYCLIFSIESGS